MTVNTAIKPSDKKSKDVAYLSKIIRHHLPKLTRKYNISYLGIFGSYIRGEQKEDSDLDILVEFSKEPDLLERVLKLHFSLFLVFYLNQSFNHDMNHGSINECLT
jgi:predicted nucleotidyltransferase